DAVRFRPVVIAAGRSPLARRDPAHLAGAEVEDVFLVAAALLRRGLEDEAPPVGAEVGLGVLSAERELADVGQVRLVRSRGEGLARADREVAAGPVRVEGWGAGRVR